MISWDHQTGGYHQLTAFPPPAQAWINLPPQTAKHRVPPDCEPTTLMYTSVPEAWASMQHP